MKLIASLFLVVMPLCVFGQPQERQPAFETASVRQSSTDERQGNSGIQATRGSVTASNTRLVQCLLWAYQVSGKISGPDWIYERYTIVAKSAESVPESQLRLMLQALLEDRFKLKLRRVTNTTRVAVLTVAKSGPKNLKPRESASANPKEGQYSSPTKLPDGEYELKNGDVSLKGVSMRSVAVWLSGRPPYGVSERVQDETGLKGLFDLTLAAKEFDMGHPASARSEPSSASELSSGLGAYEDMKSAAFSYWSVFLQRQYGLKLEYRELPVDGIIVEGGNRVPTEN